MLNSMTKYFKKQKKIKFDLIVVSIATVIIITFKVICL